MDFAAIDAFMKTSYYGMTPLCWGLSVLSGTALLAGVAFPAICDRVAVRKTEKSFAAV